MRLFCFGLGYSADALFRRLRSNSRPGPLTCPSGILSPKGEEGPAPPTSSFSPGGEGAPEGRMRGPDGRVSRSPVDNQTLCIAGTTRTGAARNDGIEVAAFDGTTRSPEATRLLAGTTHLLLSAPPGADGDPALTHHGDDIAALGKLRWIGYLSTVGVYGDRAGGWVDEAGEPRPISARSIARVAAEQAWLGFGRRLGVPTQVFRLAGIYGPGRSAIDDVRDGTARRIVKPGQVFNRIHVDDIAAVLQAAMSTPCPEAIFNVTDDEPAPADEVVAFAARLLGLAPPPAIPFEDADLSPMARSFYGECKRVRNARIKQALDVRLAYPTYREGLAAIAAG